jgi:hypothetical protein
MKLAHLFLAALFAMSGTPQSPQTNQGEQAKVLGRVQAPSILAVRTHHDMCPHCKQLKATFDALASQASDESVLLITVDLSTPTTQRQSALTVGALGIASIWTGDLSRVGTVTFLDAKTKKSLAEFRAGDDRSLESVMRSALTALRDKP